MDLEYALKEIQKNGTDLAWWRKRFLTHVVGGYFEWFGPEGMPVTNEDWDNLLMLDACRYDLFKEAADLPGITSKRQSMDSATPGFLRRTFDGGTYHDIVYITANPYVNVVLPEDTFHAVDNVWQDAWDCDLNTVHPNVMAERAREAAAVYPNKRLLVHFMQPHYPFVGDIRLEGESTFGVRNQAMTGDTLGAEDRAPTPFDKLQSEDLSQAEVWEAYESNLKYALPYIENLMTELEGLNVVTADHGNAFGERAWPFPIRVYGHPLGVKIPVLTEVPWVEYQNGRRKEISVELPKKTENQADTDVTKRLRHLGYAE